MTSAAGLIIKSAAILVLNSGSSSVKFRLFNTTENLSLLADGRITGIGVRPEFFLNGRLLQTLPHTIDHAQALQKIVQWVDHNDDNWRIEAVGHRIVHGGEKFTGPCLLTPAVLQELELLIPLAPLHQPHNLFAVKVLAELYPELRQIGCFDTAFHAHHEPLFQHYALPKFLRDSGIRRYGFHGLSYEWITRVLATQYPNSAQGRVVAAHLGNGSSLCAIKAGSSVDTTMGMSTLDGLPMGTRCGSIDPGAIFYMLRELDLDADAAERLLSCDSGLKGLSGVSNDVRDLLASDSSEARFALNYYAMMTAQQVARMAVALGGLDTLVFTGGIGEHAAPVRQQIIDHLNFLRPFEVLIVEANEERMIAEHCLSIMQEKRK